MPKTDRQLAAALPLSCTPGIPMTRPLPRRASCLFLLLALAACGEDAATNNATPADLGQGDMGPGADANPCQKNERFDTTLGTCVPDFTMQDMNSVDQASGLDLTMAPDMSPDMTPDTDEGPCVNTTLYIDGDGDEEGVDDPKTNITECIKPGEVIKGYATVSGDCDDTDVRRGSTAIELCDEVDNNCNNENNEGLECVFFAHTGEEIYAIDPFKKTATVRGNFRDLNLKPFLDMDTDPKTGTLYGITSDHLYRFDFSWNQVGGKLPEAIKGANGMAIDRYGKAYVTKEDKIFEINLEDGAIKPPATVQQYTSGNEPRTVNSSGDCVINKGDTFFVTSRNSSDPLGPDVLVFVNLSNKTTSLKGETSHRGIYGLTAAWGKLYGTTSNGEIIRIDEGTGQSSLVFKVEGTRWYGAASTPKR